MKHRENDCFNCGKKFIDIKHLNRKFCSNKCVSGYYRGKAKTRTTLRTCSTCGKEFKVVKNYKSSKYGLMCSEKCRIKARKLDGRIKEYNRVYRKKHKVRIIENNHKWYRKFRERILADVKVQRKANPKYKMWRKARRYGTGQRLTIKVVQRVYEDNIKKYGTLTCELCGKEIGFGKDSLDHKTPLTRGGSNLYDNLQIAHRLCNSTKLNKTMGEWEDYKKLVKYGGV